MIYARGLLFLVEGQPLWLECKTTKDYSGHLKKYSQHRACLSIPKERAILVVLNVPTEQTQDNTDMWDITVKNENNFAQHVETLL
jgi:hypothetical protein